MELYVKYGTSGMFALVGALMITDPLHGNIAPNLQKAAKYYPNFFPVLVGLWQLSIAALNFYEDGAYVLYAQAMQAVLMGGAIHHHAIAEGHPMSSGGAVVFLGLTYYALKDTPNAVAIIAGCTVVGFLMGSLLKALNLSGKK